MTNHALTPREIVAELDKYIIGQHKAKKLVAVALRNRYRASLLDASIRDEIIPKNILMIGPTGVGKTEIARRLAKLVNAPFIKVEATKFTEVGYVGRDVESMVRDLLETSIRMVKAEKAVNLKDKAEKLVHERIISLLIPNPTKTKSQINPFEALFSQNQALDEQEDELDPTLANERVLMGQRLDNGELEHEIIEIEMEDNAPSMLDMLGGQGTEQMGLNMQELLGSMLPKKPKKRKLTIKEARPILLQMEAQRLMDPDEVIQESIIRAEQSGIIFIDEIDKVTSQGKGSGPDVSREGVQRDILPIVEGSTILTKYGPIKTDYMLFIAAGAFHLSKPADLIPELQGRFPVRVELSSLTHEDFVRILQEPRNALTKQYVALLETEGIQIDFSAESIEEMARIAVEVNDHTENIGARRLHTILEKLLEDLSFEASDISLEHFTITAEYVKEKLVDISQNRNLSQYIL